MEHMMCLLKVVPIYCPNRLCICNIFHFRLYVLIISLYGLLTNALRTFVSISLPKFITLVDSSFPMKYVKL